MLPPTCRRAAAILIVLVLARLSGAAQVTVRIEPPTKIINLNDVFTVDLVADIAEPVVGWGLDVTLDSPGIISFDASPSIDPTWLPVASPDGDGLSAIAFPSSVSGAGVVLATLTFSADALGETDLLASYTVGDLTEGFPLDPSGFATTAFEMGHVTVIPEPGTLVFAALGWLAVMRRTRRTVRAVQPSRVARWRYMA